MTGRPDEPALTEPIVLTPPRRRATDGAPTRDRLLVAAREVIETGGYAGASVLAIAERADVASGTLYRYFPSKAELFVEVFRDVCSRELTAVERAATSVDSGTAMDRLDAIITIFAERALVSPTLAWSLIAEPVDPAVERVRLQFRAAYRTTIAALLRDGIRDGEIPPQNPELTATALVGAANEVLAGPLAHARTQVDTTDVIDALRTLWRRAAGAS